MKYIDPEIYVLFVIALLGVAFYLGRYSVKTSHININFTEGYNIGEMRGREEGEAICKTKTYDCFRGNYFEMIQCVKGL